MSRLKPGPTELDTKEGNLSTKKGAQAPFFMEI